MSDILSGMVVPQLPFDDKDQGSWNRDINFFLNNMLTKFNQANLAKTVPFTPTGTADMHGLVGTIAWDSSFLYVKTTSGWKRATLNAF